MIIRSARSSFCNSKRCCQYCTRSASTASPAEYGLLQACLSRVRLDAISAQKMSCDHHRRAVPVARVAIEDFSRACVAGRNRRRSHPLICLPRGGPLYRRGSMRRISSASARSHAECVAEVSVLCGARRGADASAVSASAAGEGHVIRWPRRSVDLRY
jgi:hypothetical protein